MFALPARVVLCLAIAPLATAQSVVFQDGFENGFAQWTATGLWNPQQSSNACMGPAAPFPEGGGAAWFGQTSTCNFATFPSFGGLQMNSWVALPAGAASITLTFQSRVDSEYCWSSWDIHSVNVTAVGGPNGGFSQQLCAFNGPIWSDVSWHARRVDLSAYAGAQVKVEFHFSSGDAAEGLFTLFPDRTDRHHGTSPDRKSVFVQHLACDGTTGSQRDLDGSLLFVRRQSDLHVRIDVRGAPGRMITILRSGQPVAACR